MAQVTLDRVEKIYKGGVRAVNGISLTIDDGRFVVLVGPSGCGKSTTLRMIAGLEEISSGTISIGDRVVNTVAPKDRDIAMVFQNYALYPHMSVYENMAFGLKLRKTPKAEIERRVRDASAILGLDDYLERKPKALSGGQRQRVAVGRAIVREPACFLFDEPLSNLDAKLRVTMRSELKALHQRLKTTTVYVTHDQEEAMTLGDLVVVMANGDIQQAGTPDEVFRTPVNRFVAGFVGMPPMNFLEGALSRAGEQVLWRESASNPAQIVLPEPLAAHAKARVGQPCVLGIRPGAISIRPDAPDSLSFLVTVAVVEPLGEQTDLRLTTPSGVLLTARVPSVHGHMPKVGETVRVAIDPARVHAFEPGPFGRALDAPVPAEPAAGTPAETAA
ncbi:MAG: sn-glycerol-3-phosphate ABC transporter ATP-binding protein UgpC [Phycisphaerales bacterium]|nr:sn-glycerol-3-phosphate ABC transporter ATP-binding protein UgpC [Planctomycetota bacterium]MCH8509218.1 sn-glycerol-3-phosphate ABC transporter ATP-binding protein UgpC [Phycisphaerales bacterium]